MTNIKYSKRFKLRNGERVDFCPECEYHITDTSGTIYLRSTNCKDAS